MDELEELDRAFADVAAGRKPTLTVEDLDAKRKATSENMEALLRKLGRIPLPADARALLVELADEIVESEEIQCLMTPAIRYACLEALHHGAALGFYYAGRPRLIREFPKVAEFLWTLNTPKGKKLLRLVNSK